MEATEQKRGPGRPRKIFTLPEAEREIRLKEEILKELKTPQTLIQLSNKFSLPPYRIEQVLSVLQQEKYNVTLAGDTVGLSNIFTEGAHKVVDTSKFENETYRIGFVSDNHLGSNKERLDVLEALYDIFEKEGIHDVYNGGNWIDGEAKFNKNEIHVFGMTNQIEYFVNHYPRRQGITTHFVAGDDHEGWYAQRECINIGEYAELKAQKAGRTDLHYLGYVEADIEFKARNGSAIMKLMHAGGGTAYALSYTPQKLVESFSGGHKPQMLLIGHYHKFDFFYYRNCWVLQMGTTQDQSTFMRKKKIAAHVGGGILEFQQGIDGAINRCKCEFFPFFDLKYYETHNFLREAA